VKKGQKGATGRVPGSFHGLGPSSHPLDPGSSAWGGRIQFAPAVEGNPGPTSSPFHLTSFDPHSENSQRFTCSLRTIPEHAPNESRRKPPKNTSIPIQKETKIGSLPSSILNKKQKGHLEIFQDGLYILSIYKLLLKYPKPLERIIEP